LKRICASSWTITKNHCGYFVCLRGKNNDSPFITLGDSAQSDKHC